VDGAQAPPFTNRDLSINRNGAKITNKGKFFIFPDLKSKLKAHPSPVVRVSNIPA
jgi:hypothetical protein